jgi:hygromycin-B 4-O-kinase
MDMNDTFPQFEEQEVRALLTMHFEDEIQSLEPIAEGQLTQTCSFVVDGRPYIIRFGLPTQADRFAKEAYVAEHYSSPALPIPAMVHIGQHAGFAFGISVRAQGRVLSKMTETEIVGYFPAMMRAADAMRQADVSHTTGYGWLNTNGGARFSSWHEHLLFLREEEPESDYYGKWHSLFDTTFLERDLFDALFAHMESLLPYCPADRHLVHSNFALPNLIGRDGILTGVIDWTDALYGDFVFDIACLALWWPQAGFDWRFADFYRQQGVEIPHYAQRLLCYQVFIGTDGLRFFAKTGNEPHYQYTRDRLLALTNLSI